MDFGMLGVILLGVCTVLFVAWQAFFTWYRKKREREQKQWNIEHPERTMSFFIESKTRHYK